ncbi:MAG: DNA-binding protein WhiA [Clostridiales bacterium]|nr:DNA-binding protein WhiA [Clostridiales bacterium]
MSFSSRVKNELCRIVNEDKCCTLCEISAVLRLGAVFNTESNGFVTTNIITENAALARRIITDAVRMFDFHPNIAIEKRKKLKGHTVYIAELKGAFATNVALGDMGFIKLDDSKRAVFSSIDQIIGGECCFKSYLRGAFLASGSVSAPDRGYHLEITAQNEDEIKRICMAMESFGINAKITSRKNHRVCYVKEAEGIADFLNLTGAHKALLEFENVRVLKNIRNNINRVVNFETANLNKIVNASVSQCEDIRFIEKSMGFGLLSDDLRRMAEVRIENPEASLTELGMLMSPVLGKSGVSHRLGKLHKLAENIRNRNS